MNSLLRKSAAVALISAAQANMDFYFKPREEVELTPNPGSISSTMYVPSVNHILGVVIPLAANELFTNHTFNIDYSKSGLFGIYNVELDSITTNSVTVGDRKLAFVEGTDTLELTIDGIDVDATMVGKATAAKMIPASIEAFTFTGLQVVLDVETTSEDEVHFKVGGSSYFHIDDFSLTMGQKVWQTLVNLNHGLLLGLINGFLKTGLPNKIHGKVDQFNTKVANEGPMSFMTTLLSDKLPLNYTSTKYPQFRSADNMIELHLDGRFLDVSTGTINVQQNEDWQPREDLPQREQFFLSEAAANSLLFAISDSYMPLMISSEDLAAQLLQLFPELKLKYGFDVEVEIGVKLAEDNTDQAIQFSTERGIIFGDRTLNDMKTYLQLYCTNSTTDQELALELELSLELIIDFLVENFKIQAQVTENSISSTQVLVDNVGMFYHNYDVELSAVLNSFVYNFNTSHSDGIDLTNNKTVKLLNSVLRKSVITPYEMDGQLYAGFKWISDH